MRVGRWCDRCRGVDGGIGWASSVVRLRRALIGCMEHEGDDLGFSAAAVDPLCLLSIRPDDSDVWHASNVSDPSTRADLDVSPTPGPGRVHRREASRRYHGAALCFPRLDTVTGLRPHCSSLLLSTRSYYPLRFCYPHPLSLSLSRTRYIMHPSSGHAFLDIPR